MTRGEDSQVGALALEQGLVTPEQLQECLREQAAQNPRRPVGVLLVARGYLTDEQLVRLIDEQRRRRNEAADFETVRREDRLFGKLLVQNGRVTQEALEAALRLQAEEAEEGKPRRLGEILVEQGVLTPEAVQETLRLQGKSLMACPGCDARYNVAGFVAGRAYECKKCGAKLVRSESVRADETVAPSGPRDLDPLKLAEDPNKCVGKFVLVQQVGAGGMGTVYKAWQRDLGRYVALKFLQSQDGEAIARFAREAQTSAKLSHPSIVPIYEVGQVDGKHYISMEFIEGQTLDKLRLDPKKAAEILAVVAAAIQYAHDKGIIHRDIKPQNLMLGNDGHVWVMDFGLARQQGSATLTGQGVAVGTPAYMPPEQAWGEKCDVRSDVYSLGATLYQLLTGQPPFQATAGAMEVIHKVIVDEPMAIRIVSPAVPMELQIVVQKAMEKDASRRYPTAREFAEDLRRHLSGEPILAKPISLFRRGVKWVNRHRSLSAAAGVILAGVVVLGAVLLVRSVRFQRKIASLLRDAGQARSEGRFADARELYAEVRALVPGHAGAAQGFAEAEAGERRKAAALWVDKGRGLRTKYDGLRAELAVLEKERRDLLAVIEPYEEAKKQPVWDRDRVIEGKGKEAAACFSEVVVAFTAALGADPEYREARSSLAALYFAEFERAEMAYNGADAELYERLTKLFDDGTFAAQLDRGGTVLIDSVPAGAELHLFRYETGRDGRWMPRPFNLGRRESRIPKVEATPQSAYALEFSDFNRAAPGETRLSNGSYLFVLRKEGFGEARFPVAIGRGTKVRATVQLYTTAQIGEGFVYVPAGKFLMGGDEKAYLSGDRNPEAETEDFFIGRCEVTVEKYTKFLNDREFHTLKEALRRSPRHSERTSEHAKVKDDVIHITPMLPMEPICEISWEDAKAYCEWLNRREKGTGITYRLPTTVEWEKAARGVDGRFFPWGNRFDWTFTKGAHSQEGEPKAGFIGNHKADESPYGVRDLAGNMREWCEEDVLLQESKYKVARGGYYSVANEAFFHAAARGYYGTPRSVTKSVGFRVVRVPAGR